MADPVHVTVHGSGDRALFVHGAMSWGRPSRPPLAQRWRLELMDRRGYGESPDVEHSDAEVDADDLVALLDDGPPAHLVGHSFGTVVVLPAAARRPAAVRSLTLIESSCLAAVAEDDPVIARAVTRNRAVLAAGPPEPTPAEYLRLSTESLGLPPLEPTPERLRAAATVLRERPCWEVDVPLAAVAAGDYPELVLSGTWEAAPEAYRTAGRAERAAGRRPAASAPSCARCPAPRTSRTGSGPRSSTKRWPGSGAAVRHDAAVRRIGHHGQRSHHEHAHHA